MKTFLTLLILLFAGSAWAIPPSPPIGTKSIPGIIDTTALYNLCKTITNPNDADAFLIGANQQGGAWTIDEIRATALGGTSVVFTVQECDANGANCAAVMDALTVTTGTVGTATITDSSIADNAFLLIDIGTVTGAVTQLTVCVE